MIPTGVHDAIVTDVVGKTRQDKDPMLVIEYTVDEQTINEYFVINDTGKGAEILAERLKIYDGHNFPVLETIDDLERYVKKYLLKKPVKVAIRHRESLYTRRDTGEMAVRLNASVAYAGEPGRDLPFDVTKAVLGLSARERQEWENYQAGMGSGAMTPEEGDGIDIPDAGEPEPEPEPEREPTPKKAVAKKAAASKSAPKPEDKPAEKADSGLSFIDEEEESEDSGEEAEDLSFLD